MTKWVSLTLSAELNAALNAVHAESGLSRSEIMRQSLLLFLEVNYRNSVVYDRKTVIKPTEIAS
ncbi:MAG: ribbon-helix-helix domain-containing protein [Anaerolineae bacterium]|nr:ribbon-helix-helix domain-containing protein [Anaerolineae bacterium]